MDSLKSGWNSLTGSGNNEEGEGLFGVSFAPLIQLSQPLYYGQQIITCKYNKGANVMNKS